ncbi:MAG: hypothetical protein F6K18_08120 [Okeania sp. SIO2C2]|nr:hypothetical protein [Okeania sp. SIO2C2]NEP86803.1 hypothetical protein [Okeania sp. SIO2C2]
MKNATYLLVNRHLSNLRNTIAVLMVRVNPIIGEVEFTTPNLWQNN